MRRNSYSLGLLLIIASTIAWSTAGLFTRLLQTDLATTLVWRGVFGFLGIAAFTVLVEGRNGLMRFARLGRAGWIFAVISAFGMLTYIAALTHTSVAHVAIIYAAVPFVAAGLGWLVLRELPSRSAMLASLAALLGIVVMVGLGREGSAWGDFYAFLMTVSVASMMVFVRYAPEMPALQAAALSSLLSALVALPLSAPLSPQGLDWITLAGFGIVNSSLGLALFVLGSRRLPPVETALIGALDAPLAPLWVWLLMSETPVTATLLGGAIVFAAVITHILASQKQSPAKDIAGKT
ncbi:MAG: DMT family transporter [Proteobacteria bacterium]|nr:DMT family transporter [Pseudomonadota bacterium]